MGSDSYNAAVIDAAARHMGVAEWPGAKSNPAVEVFFARAGHPGLKDDVPWCAAFVGAVLAECGLVPSGSLMARSYLTWGRKIAPQDALPGDVVVLSRGTPPAGHVGFFVAFDGARVILRGGNQGDAVSDAGFPAASILGIRRADPVAGAGRATIRAGDQGAFVLDLQDQLATLGYFAGRVDGLFGPRTREAVLAFQADHGLDTDGIVGPRTWAALADATPRPRRAVDKAELARTSRTMKAATNIDIAAGAAGVGTVLASVRDAADQATGLLPTLRLLVTDYWPFLAAAAVLLIVLYLSGRIRDYRVEDAETGRNIGR